MMVIIKHYPDEQPTCSQALMQLKHWDIKLLRFDQVHVREDKIITKLCMMSDG